MDDDLLRNAIEQQMRQQGMDPGAVITDYIVIMGVQQLTADNTLVNSMTVLHPPGVPHYRLVGLLDLASDTLRGKTARLG